MTRRRVTFSRNLTLSLWRTCRCHGKSCAFATHRPHLYGIRRRYELATAA